MGRIRDLFLGPDPSIYTNSLDQVARSAPRFAVTPDDIPAELFGLQSYSSPIAPAPRVSRREAIQVPAVKRCRDLIAGTLGSLPLDLYNPARNQVSSSFFEQPEPDVPRSVTLTRTLEDLLLEGVAWWRVLQFDFDGYPLKVRRLEPRSVNVQQDGKVYVSHGGKHTGNAQEWVQDAELIRFDSPNDPLLVAAARAIRTCLMLDAAAANGASGVPPVDYFTPAEGADPADDDDVADLLGAWQTARQTRRTAYVPAALKYNIAGWNPEQLQLVEQRQAAVADIGRACGIDGEDLGVSTTSRTYFNAFDRRKAFIDFTLGGYRQAVEDRLSMGDVTKRGWYARFNLSAFLRSDDKTRMETYALGVQVGAYTQPEIRELEDRPPLDPDEQRSLRAVPDPQEATS